MAGMDKTKVKKAKMMRGGKNTKKKVTKKGAGMKTKMQKKGAGKTLEMRGMKGGKGPKIEPFQEMMFKKFGGGKT
jgi:hypothetical protein